MFDREVYSIYQRSTFDFYRQAWALHNGGKNVEALRKVERDLILNPDHAKGLTLIGRIHEQRREYRRALEAYKQLIGFHPNLSLGPRMIGRVFEMEKRWDQAIKSYELSLELNPRQHDVLNNLALLYAVQRENPKKGLSLIERALMLRPKTVKYLDTLAKIRKSLGQKEDFRTAKLREASNRRMKSRSAQALNSTSSDAIHPAWNKKKEAASPKVGALPFPPRVSPDGSVSPRTKWHFRRELFVMNPSLKREGWRESNSAAEASLFAKAENGSSGKAVSAPERIQILDGSGDMSNVRRVKTLLISKGFRITRIGKSDKGLWRRTVLYYKKASEWRAKQVAGAISGRLLLRPLKWRSVYDIILVVGKDQAAL